MLISTNLVNGERVRGGGGDRGREGGGSVTILTTIIWAILLPLAQTGIKTVEVTELSNETKPVSEPQTCSLVISCAFLIIEHVSRND